MARNGFYIGVLHSAGNDCRLGTFVEAQSSLSRVTLQLSGNLHHIHPFEMRVWHEAGDSNALRVTPFAKIRRNVRVELAPVLGMRQASQRGVTPPFQSPAWEQCARQRSTASEVGILVPRQVDALAARALE